MFCSQMSCSVNVHCDKWMVRISLRGEFAYRIPPLHLSQILQRKYAPCVLHLNIHGGWGHWKKFPRWLLLLFLPCLWGSPNGSKDASQLQVLQLQVLNGILQRPINMNLLENTAFRLHSISSSNLSTVSVQRDVRTHTKVPCPLSASFFGSASSQCSRDCHCLY